MPRIGKTYDVPMGGGATPSHQAAVTSANTTDVKTITAPKDAAGFWITVETTSCRLTWDGQTPDATHGLVFPAAAQPLFIPIGRDVKFVSTAAANSIVQLAWVA